jgi:hypothetical protein
MHFSGVVDASRTAGIASAQRVDGLPDSNAKRSAFPAPPTPQARTRGVNNVISQFDGSYHDAPHVLALTRARI